MAPSHGNVVDFANKLRVIELIENGDFKNAAQKARNLVSSYPNSVYANALRAWANQGPERAEASQQSLDRTMELFYELGAAEYDDFTLKTLEKVFTRLGRFDLMVKCYEHICIVHPGNVECTECLFYAHVRNYDYGQQIATAIKLLRDAPDEKKEKYLLWKVCSSISQVCLKGTPEEKDKVLDLSYKVIGRHIHEYNGLKEPEALLVYIFLMEQLSKFRDAFNFLSGEHGGLMVFPFDQFRIKGRLLLRAGDYGHATQMYEEALRLCPDDWECFLHYAGSLLRVNTISEDADGNPVYPPKSVDCTKLNLTDEEFDTCMRSASTFINELLLIDENAKLRGPYLAKLEIERMKLEYGRGDIDELQHLLAEYYGRFGGLSCFTSDIEPFLPIMDSHGKTVMWCDFETNCAEDASSSTDSTKLQQQVALFKIRLYDEKLFIFSTKGLYKTAKQMMELYCIGLPLSKACDPQEVMISEELLSMISDVLVQLFWRTKEIGYFLESIMILEFGLAVRSLIWQYKIQLLHLYSFWGCLPVAYQWYTSLDVKNILLESVLHHILPQMLIAPRWSELDVLLKSYLDFMDEYMRDSGDFTSFAYRHQSYSKVVEFIKFKQRLQHSSQYMVAKIESAIVKLKINYDSITNAENILTKLQWEDLMAFKEPLENTPWTFNEDFDLRPWWTPTHNKNYLSGPFENYEPKETMIDKAKESVVKAIQKRSLILRMLHLSIICVSSKDPSTAQSLRDLLGKYALHLDSNFEEALQLVNAISSGQNSLETSKLNIVDWMNFVVFFHAWNVACDKVEEEEELSSWSVVNSLAKKCIEVKVESMNPLMCPGSDFLEVVQLVSEPFAWHRLIIQSYTRPFPKPKQPPPNKNRGKSKGKGKGKGKAGDEDAFLRNPNLVRQEVQDSVRSFIDAIEEFRDWLEIEMSEEVETRREALLSSLSKDEGKIEAHPGGIFSILQSYVNSVTEDQVGNRIFTAMKNWNAASVAEALVKGQREILEESLKVCRDAIGPLRNLIIPG